MKYIIGNTLFFGFIGSWVGGELRLNLVPVLLRVLSYI